jgi:bifunctional ADP-heptose synthase (sugar kinase/adenylyltransferase)
VLFEEETPHDPEEVVGREVVEAYGGKVVLTSKRDGASTTRLLATLGAAPVAAAPL